MPGLVKGKCSSLSFLAFRLEPRSQNSYRSSVCNQVEHPAVATAGALVRYSGTDPEHSRSSVTDTVVHHNTPNPGR